MLTPVFRRGLLSSASSSCHRIILVGCVSGLHTSPVASSKEEVVSSFHHLLRLHPPPSVIEFTKLLSSLVRMKHFETAISLSQQLHLSK